MVGNFSDPEVDLKLTILPSCLRITVHGHLPPPKETLGIIAIIRIRGVRRQVRSGRRAICGIGGPIGPKRERTEAVIQDKSMGESKKGIVDMSRRCSILPHTVDALPNRHLLRLALAMAIFSGHGSQGGKREELLWDS
jgi:hypothetical protein